MSAPVVRSPRPEDGELLSRVQRRAVLALPAVHYSRPVTLAWAESFTPVLARTVLTLSTTSVLKVAELGCRVMGFGWLDRDEIRALYVAPRAAGKGLGSALLAALEESAARSGCARVRLNSSLNAEHFYNARGYRSIRPGTVLLGKKLALECIVMDKTIL